MTKEQLENYLSDLNLSYFTEEELCEIYNSLKSTIDRIEERIGREEMENESHNVIYPLGATFYQYGDKTPNELFSDTKWEYRGIIQGVPWWVRIE